MNEPEKLSDTELLYMLRMDYFEAIRSEDYYRIQATIVPTFRKRFAKYYNEYEKELEEHLRTPPARPRCAEPDGAAEG